MNVLKPGDLVRFIDDVGEGRVVRVLSNGMVEIRTHDGWEMPVYANRLVFIPEDKAGRPSPIIPEVPANVIQATSSDRERSGKVDKVGGAGVFLVVTRMEDPKGEFAGIRLQLVNDTGGTFLAVIYELMENRAKVVVEDALEPGLMLLLDSYPLARLAELNAFLIQGVLIPPDDAVPGKPIDFQIPIQIRKFASPGSYLANDFLEEPAQLFRLDHSPVLEVKPDVKPEQLLEVGLGKDRTDKQTVSTSRSRADSADRIPVVVDLHINKLIDSVIGLDNSRILAIQMDRFRKELEAAIIDNEREIIFIHGIGNGTLKTELRRVVDEEYPFCHHEDASYRDYGFGATRVLIRQNKKV